MIHTSDVQVVEAVRSALKAQFSEPAITRFAVAGNTDSGAVIVDETGRAFEVWVRAL